MHPVQGKFMVEWSNVEVRHPRPRVRIPIRIPDPLVLYIIVSIFHIPFELGVTKRNPLKNWARNLKCKRIKKFFELSFHK